MKNLIFVASFIYLMSGCRKEEDTYVVTSVQNPIIDSNWVKLDTVSGNIAVDNLFDKLATTSETQTADLSKDINLKFKNCSVFIPFGILEDENGDNVTAGTCTVNFILVNSFGDIIRYNRPTVRKGGGLLITGGSYYIDVSWSGKSLTPASGSYYNVKYIPTYGVDKSVTMYPYEGINVSKGLNEWSLLRDSSLITTFDSTAQQGLKLGYNALISKFGWVNCDYFRDITPLVKPCVVLPTQFTNVNTSVFLVFKSLKIVANLYGDHDLKKFCVLKLYSGLPENEQAEMVTISQIGTDLYLGKFSDKITTKDFNITPVKTTLADINSYLNSL